MVSSKIVVMLYLPVQRLCKRVRAGNENRIVIDHIQKTLLIFNYVHGKYLALFSLLTLLLQTSCKHVLAKKV